MKIRVISCAEQELAEAVDYYNEQCPGLGYEFAAEINNTFDRIKSFPDAWRGVLYQVRQNFILVTAIMHLKRDPKKWQERIKKTTS